MNRASSPPPFPLLCALTALMIASAHPQSTTNLLASADTSLLEVAPDNNLGATPDIPAGTVNDLSRSRALFRFNVSGIPTNATITAASFKIQVVKKNLFGVGSTFDLHRVLQDWGEGIGSSVSGLRTGDPANPGEATWNNRFHPNTPWGAPGGATNLDFVEAVSSSHVMDALGSYTFESTPTMVSDVQAWVTNPGTNFGWILLSESEATADTARRITSRSDTLNGPILSIAYTVPSPSPPPTAPQISGSVAAGQFLLTFLAESNRAYTVEFGSTLPPASWTTLTNIPAQIEDTLMTIIDPIGAGNGFYRVRIP